MDAWFAHWFDGDYHRLYAHRDPAEAARAVATVLALAPELARGPVLDLGCGAGRHLDRLLDRNPEAFGLDLSASLLGRAPARLRPRLLRGDMRQLPLRRGTLAGICLWFTAFGYFDDATNLALLARLAELLRPGGILVLDYLNAPQLRATLVADGEEQRGELRVRSRRSIEAGRLVKRITFQQPSGRERQVLESVRLYEPEELEAHATACGLVLRARLGDYDGAPWEPASPRWIGLFCKSPFPSKG